MEGASMVTKALAARPVYPRRLFNFIFRYHERSPGARWDRALDLGCGTGQSTLELTSFKTVTGIDHRAELIDEAERKLVSSKFSNHRTVKYIRCPPESVGFANDASVDMVVSGQVDHWLDWRGLWHQAARLLRPRGTFAAWGYSEFRIAGCPSTWPLVHQHFHPTDISDPLAHRQRTQSRIDFDRNDFNVPDPEDVACNAFEDVTRLAFTLPHYSDLESPQPVILRQQMTWATFKRYCESISFLAARTAESRSGRTLPGLEGGDDFLTRLRDAVARERGVSPGTLQEGDSLLIEWPLALILARRA